jgi:hypothetical protein
MRIDRAGYFSCAWTTPAHNNTPASADIQNARTVSPFADATGQTRIALPAIQPAIYRDDPAMATPRCPL